MNQKQAETLVNVVFASLRLNNHLSREHFERAVADVLALTDEDLARTTRGKASAIMRRRADICRDLAHDAELRASVLDSFVAAFKWTDADLAMAGRLNAAGDAFEALADVAEESGR